MDRDYDRKIITEHFGIEFMNRWGGWAVYALSDGENVTSGFRDEGVATAEAHRRERVLTGNLTEEDRQRQARTERIQARIDAYRAEEQAEAEAKAQQEQAKARAAQAGEELATGRQVAFIMQLIEQDRHEGLWMSAPRTEEAVRKMTKRQASQYISAMLEN